LSQVFDRRALRSAFGQFATGVTVITGTRPTGEPVGVTANSFTSVSLEPALLLWCLQNESTSFDAFGVGRAFVVNVLASGQDHQAMHFAKRAEAKFASGPMVEAQRAPRLTGALCRIDCVVETTHMGGDHTIIVGRVTAFENAGGAPLLYHAGRFGAFSGSPESREVNTWETFSGEWF
jgi:flavin reductase (DIM6/NTAB) family NADH-FMN oxidoreductase RutF